MLVYSVVDLIKFYDICDEGKGDREGAVFNGK